MRSAIRRPGEHQNGKGKRQLGADATILLVFYRYRLHQKWLFFEIAPQLHFPNANNYAVSPALSIRLQMLFDDARASQ